MGPAQVRCIDVDVCAAKNESGLTHPFWFRKSSFEAIISSFESIEPLIVAL
jgi:hypothetical protein